MSKNYSIEQIKDLPNQTEKPTLEMIEFLKSTTINTIKNYSDVREQIKLLVENKADVNYSSESTPLSSFGKIISNYITTLKIEDIKFLVQNKADVNYKLPKDFLKFYIPSGLWNTLPSLHNYQPPLFELCFQKKYLPEVDKDLIIFLIEHKASLEKIQLIEANFGIFLPEFAQNFGNITKKDIECFVQNRDTGFEYELKNYSKKLIEQKQFEPEALMHLIDQKIIILNSGENRIGTRIRGNKEYYEKLEKEANRKDLCSIFEKYYDNKSINIEFLHKHSAPLYLILDKIFSNKNLHENDIKCVLKNNICDNLDRNHKLGDTTYFNLILQNNSFQNVALKTLVEAKATLNTLTSKSLYAICCNPNIPINDLSAIESVILPEKNYRKGKINLSESYEKNPSYYNLILLNKLILIDGLKILNNYIDLKHGTPYLHILCNKIMDPKQKNEAIKYIMFGDKELDKKDIKFLLEAKSNIQTKNSDGTTYIQNIYEKFGGFNLEDLNLLLSLEPNVFFYDHNGTSKTALETIFTDENSTPEQFTKIIDRIKKDCIKKLNSTLTTNTQDNKLLLETMMAHNAFKPQHVKLLLEAKADLNQKHSNSELTLQETYCLNHAEELIKCSGDSIDQNFIDQN